MFQNVKITVSYGLKSWDRAASDIAIEVLWNVGYAYYSVLLLYVGYTYYSVLLKLYLFRSLAFTAYTFYKITCIQHIYILHAQ